MLRGRRLRPPLEHERSEGTDTLSADHDRGMMISQIRLSALDLLRKKLAPLEPTDEMYAGLAAEIEASVLQVLHSPQFARDGHPETFVSNVRIDGEVAWGVQYSVTATALDDGGVDATVALLGLKLPGVERLISLPDR